MFGFQGSKSPTSKAYVSHGTLPPHIDPGQPPSKKTPFSTILSQTFTHTVQLILPQELYDVVWKDVEAKISNIQYARLIMSLSEILEGDFFNQYIKIGNILMLSEGRPGVDDRYSLKDGILRLELAKDKYERCGLVGHPIRDAGRKHIKTRYAVEINLRSPAMLHGKKGFERIVWAFKNVLNQSVTWLFHDFILNPDHGKAITIVKSFDKVADCSKAANEAPISKHHPVINECLPEQKTMKRVRVPNLSPPRSSESEDGFKYWALETYEWLSLVATESPRVCSEDTIDPFLSRYQVSDRDSEKISNMVTLRWTGLIPTCWVRQIFIYLSSAKISARTGGDQLFFALSAYSFKTAVTDQKDAYTILCLEDGAMNSHSAIAAAGKTDASRDTKAAQRYGKEYILWELTHG